MAFVLFISIMSDEDHSKEHHESMAATVLMCIALFLFALALDLAFAVW